MQNRTIIVRKAESISGTKKPAYEQEKKNIFSNFVKTTLGTKETKRIVSRSIRVIKDDNVEDLDNIRIVNSVKEDIPKQKKSKGVHLIISEVLDENLCDDGNEIKKIYHLSDIHISKHDDRHDEYMIVFKNLVTEINKDTDNAIIVICGDILHEKNIMSPQQLLLAKKFFIMLSELLPCFVIIGNHDVAPQGNTIDSLTPILKNLRTKNKIYLLLEDKCYHYNNITFGMTSIFTNIVTPCTTKDKIKIGLYHGTLSGTKLENGHELTSPGMFNMTDFKKYYDYVLLGDIHKHSYLDAKKTVAYPGSLLQTRHGEDLEHGILKWDLVKKNSKFIIINNDWGFVKLQCTEKGIIGNLKKLPKNPIIKMEYENITMSDAEKYANILRNKYNAKCELSCIVNKNVDIKIGDGKKKRKLIDINNNEAVLMMITEYVKNNYKYNTKIINDMTKKLTELVKSLKYDYANVVKKFVLKRLKFNNFFNFGTDNELNYTNMNGIIGFDGNSYVGKTTACVDALLYSIFGKCSRGDKFDTVNVDRKYMSTYVEFDLNGESYRIVRKRDITGNVAKRSSNEKVVLYKNEANISKETTDTTNKEIEKIVCEYEVFLGASVMLQNNATSFVDLSNTQRKDLICGMLNLNVFNSMSKLATKQRFDIKYLLNNGNYPTDDQVTDLNCILSENENEYEEILKDIVLLDRDVFLITKEINEYMIFLEQLNFDKNDYLRIKTNINNLKQQMTHVIENYEKTIMKKNLCDNILLHNISEKNKYDEKLGKYVDVCEKNNQFQENKIRELQILNERLEGLLSKRIPNNNKLTQKYIKCKIGENNTKLKNVNENIIVFKNKLCEMQKKIKIINKRKDLDDGYESFCEYKKKHIELFDEINTIRVKLVDMEIKQKKLHAHQYDPECNYCMNYPITVEKIVCNEEIINIQNELLNLNNINTKNNVQLKKYEKFNNMYVEYCTLIENNIFNNNIINNMNESIRGLIIEKNILEENINKFEEIIRMENDNNQIDQECKVIKEEILTVNKKTYREFIDYHKIKELRSENIDKIYTLQKESHDLEKEITHLEKKKNDLQSEMNKFSDYTHKLEEYEEIESHIIWLRNEMKKYVILLDTTKLYENKIKNNILIGEVNVQNMERQIKHHNEKEHERDILDIIIKIIGKKGLVENILTNNIIPKIENDINAMIETIMNYKISIVYNNGFFKINKICDGKYVNIDTLSGCEKFMTNICFKLILENYNNRFKANYLILDELFNCCDDLNVEKLDSLFDVIKAQYDFVMVISHDDRIKKLYDTTIDVVRENNMSSILFV
jgi:DNA repair protein SbcC/Rad50